MSAREAITRYLERKGESTHFVSQPCTWKIDPRIISFLQKLKYHGVSACVAGGYPSFLSGKTNVYTDVDVFINATSTFVTPRTAKLLLQRIFGSTFHTIKQWDNKISNDYIVRKTCYHLAAIVSLFDEVGEIQCIFLDGLVVSQFSQELFCFEVINRFDTFLIKTGFFLEKDPSKNLNEANTEENKEKGTSLSSSSLSPTPHVYSICLQVPTKTNFTESAADVKEARMKKNAARDQVKFFNPNKLSTICITEILQYLRNMQ